MSAAEPRFFGADVSLVIEGRIGTLTIERPEAGNAFRPETMEGIVGAVETVADDEGVGALILAGRGRHFGAGGDFDFLDDLRGRSEAEVRDSIYRSFQAAARGLYRLPKPTVAAVSGAAITVGCELALACDFRIASPSARFHESWLRVGLLPPLGGMFSLPRLIGHARAAEIILRARPIDGEEAAAIGLATACVAEEELQNAALELARELSGLAPLAYAAAKRGMQDAASSAIEQCWSSGLDDQARLIGTEDFAEGIAAARGKRKPVFRGS
jgi:enoyl-CoA hydratase/carnithine racemase